MRVVLLRLTAVLLAALAAIPAVAPPRASAQVTEVPDVLWGAGLRPGTTVEATIGGKSCGSADAQPNGVWALYVVDDSACDDVPLASWDLRVDGEPAEELLFSIEHALLPDFVIGLQPVTRSPGQISLTTFGGGALDSLQWSLRQSGLRSMFFTEDGGMVGYTNGAPSFVNEAFNDAFAGGVPDSQPLIVVQDPNYLPLPVRLLPNAGTYLLVDPLDPGLTNDLGMFVLQDDGQDVRMTFTGHRPFTFNFNGPDFSAVRLFADFDGDGAFDFFTGASHGEAGAGSTAPGGPTFSPQISPANPEGATSFTVTVPTENFPSRAFSIQLATHFLGRLEDISLTPVEESPELELIEIFFPRR